MWFNKMEKKYGKYAIPNLTKYLILCYAIGYVFLIGSATGNLALSKMMSYFYLDVHAILHGQVWRLVTWLLIPPGGISIFTLVMLYCYYSIGNLLERTWGTFRYNVFMFSGLLFTLLGAFLLYGIVVLFAQGSVMDAESLAALSSGLGLHFSTYYVSMSIFLAFAFTYPDAQMLFMFVLPIKTKVLGIIYVIYMVYQIFDAFTASVIYGVVQLVVIGFSLLNVLSFFVVTRTGFRTPQQMKRQREFAKQTVKVKKITRHKCAICGRSEETDPEEEFRFCSKCNGNYEYCSKHLYTHTHVK